MGKELPYEKMARRSEEMQVEALRLAEQLVEVMKGEVSELRTTPDSCGKLGIIENIFKRSIP